MRVKTFFFIVFQITFISKTKAQPASKSAKPTTQTKKQAQSTKGRSSTKSNNVKDLQLQVQALQEQISRLEQNLKGATRAAGLNQAVLQKMDRLKAKIEALSEEIAATRTRLGDIERKKTTPIDTTAKAAVGGWQSGYHNGYYWQSPAGKFKLKIDGYIIAGYDFLLVGPRSGDLRPLDPYGWPDRHGFAVHNARPGLSGHILTPKLRYKLRLEMASKPRLTHAYLSYNPLSFLTITGGQMKVCDSWQSLRSSGRLQLADRSVATQGFASGYDAGLRVTFREWKKRLFQQIGVYSGSGRNLPNENVALHYVLRAGIQPLGPVPLTEDDALGSVSPKLHFALSAGYNKLPAGDLDGDTVVDDKQVFHFGAEGAFFWKGLSVSSEFFYRLEDHTDAVDETCPQHYLDTHTKCARFQKFWGVYGQAGYYVWRKLQLSGRYAYAQLSTGSYHPESQSWKRSWTSPQALSGLHPETIHEATGGVSYDLYRYNIRLGLYYTWYWERGYRLDEDHPSESRHLHWIRVQTRLVF
jgi:hypothetical protein